MVSKIAKVKNIVLDLLSDGKEHSSEEMKILIQKDGIDKTIIPITKNGEIIDGAHRLAIALYFNLKVPFVMFDLLDANYNKQFFINRGFNEKYAKIIDKEIVEKNNYNIDLEGIKKWRKKIIQKYLWYCVP